MAMAMANPLRILSAYFITSASCLINAYTRDDLPRILEYQTRQVTYQDTTSTLQRDDHEGQLGEAVKITLHFDFDELTVAEEVDDSNTNAEYGKLHIPRPQRHLAPLEELFEVHGPKSGAAAIKEHSSEAYSSVTVDLLRRIDR